MATRVGTAYIPVRGDWSAFNRDVTTRGRALTAQFGKLGSGLGSALSHGAATGIKVGAAAVAGGFLYATKKAADFEAQVSSLASVSGASAKQLDRLRDQALKAGAATKFSALQAAQAQTELAKGGLSVAQITRGGLKSALALAAAGELELADAAATTVNAMKLFGLRGKESMRVADGLATAANRTTADVSDFALALTQGGSAAKAAGFDFTETTAALEALAQIGVKGSDAGTSLKAALSQIASPTDESAELMKKLGIAFFDANGNMKPLADVADLLRKRLSGLTREQRLQATTTIAGTDGTRALLALYDAGPEKIQKYERELAKQGTAAEVARQKQDNLKGAMENLGGSVETLGITVGTALIPSLRLGAGELTKFTNKINNLLSRKDLSLGDKLQRSLNIARVQAEPWVAKFRTSLDNANLPQRISEVVETASPKIADALATAAPHAAAAFVRAFREAGPWGKLLTVAFLAKRLGAFNTLGGMAADRFTDRFRKRTAVQMEANLAAQAAEGGAMAKASKGYGRGLGLIAGAAFVYAFSNEIEDAAKTAVGFFKRETKDVAKDLKDGKSILGAAIKDFGPGKTPDQQRMQDEIDRNKAKRLGTIGKGGAGLTSPGGLGGLPQSRPGSDAAQRSSREGRVARARAPRRQPVDHAQRRQRTREVSEGVGEALAKHDRRTRRRTDRKQKKTEAPKRRERRVDPRIAIADAQRKRAASAHDKAVARARRAAAATDRFQLNLATDVLPTVYQVRRNRAQAPSLGAQHQSTTTIHRVDINIHGAGKNAREIARETAAELDKVRRTHGAGVRRARAGVRR